MSELIDESTGEIIESEVVDGSLILASQERGQIDIQIATAKKYPRSVDKARKDVLTLATLNEKVAGDCFYMLPRDKKPIEGPSSRFAEILQYGWGNIRSQGDVIGIDDKYVVAVGMAFDLEKNSAYKVSVKRKITNKYGKRYTDDMIGVTANAAVSIAIRNAILKVIPKPLWWDIYEAARKASLGKGRTIQKKRDEMLTWFKKVGLNEKQVCEIVGARGMDDIGEEQLITLLGLMTAIKDGDTSVDQILSKGHIETEGTAEINKVMKEAIEAGVYPPGEITPPI